LNIILFIEMSCWPPLTLQQQKINTFVKLCSLLHQRYADFSNSLVPELQKLFVIVKGKFNIGFDVSIFILICITLGASTETEQERSAKFIKKRVFLRLLCELLEVAVFTDYDVVFNIVQVFS